MQYQKPATVEFYRFVREPLGLAVEIDLLKIAKSAGLLPEDTPVHQYAAWMNKAEKGKVRLQLDVRQDAKNVVGVTKTYVPDENLENWCAVNEDSSFLLDGKFPKGTLEASAFETLFHYATILEMGKDSRTR